MVTPVPRGHAVAEFGESAGAGAMRALLAQCEQAGVRVRRYGEHHDIRALRAVVLAAGGFSFNRDMVAAHIPAVGASSAPLGIPYNDGAGIALGQSVGGTVEEMAGVVGTASFYPPANLIKGILVNAPGERFVAEDSYHGRTASHIMQQPEQVAYLIVDADIFAYPELEFPRHRLIDGWETVEEMESALGLLNGSLQTTLAQYNADATAGMDSRFYKHPDWLKPLDAAPYASFDVSFSRSTYLYLTLGGLSTDVHGAVLNEAGAPLNRLYAVGGTAAHLPISGMSYASGLSLATGSFFGRQAGRHAATGIKS